MQTAGGNAEMQNGCAKKLRNKSTWKMEDQFWRVEQCTQKYRQKEGKINNKKLLKKKRRIVANLKLTQK
jgi:hypothetical protein